MNIESIQINRALLERFQSLTGRDPEKDELEYEQATRFNLFLVSKEQGCAIILPCATFLISMASVNNGGLSPYVIPFKEMSEGEFLLIYLASILLPTALAFHLAASVFRRTRKEERLKLREAIEKTTASLMFLQDARRLSELLGKESVDKPIGALMNLADEQLRHRAIGLTKTWAEDPMTYLNETGRNRLSKFNEAFSCFHRLHLVEGTYHRYFKLAAN
jgi:hypothetical protein